MAFPQTFQASVLMASASAISMATGLLRGKLVAMVLGPAGVGMMGVLSQLITSLTQIYSFGLGNSAVRHLAGVEGEERAQREAAVFSFSYRLGFYGVVMSLIAALPVCLATFGNFDNLSYVATASLAASVAVVSIALGAILQARGSILLVAKTQIYASVAAFVIAVPLIYAGGTWGIVGALFASVSMPIIFLRKYVGLPLLINKVTFSATGGVSPLVGMGFALIGTIFVAQASAYLVRMVIVHELGLVQAGYYQAAFSISGNIPAFIFAAMSVDFYPRVAAAKNGTEALLITERQVKEGAILATPCFIGLILFSHYFVQLLYSNEFLEAIPLIRWMTWGVACRLVSWPLGYWLLAHATPKELFWIEGLGSVSTMAMTFALIPWTGLTGSGIAFVFGAVTYGVVAIAFVRRKTGKLISLESMKWASAAALALVVAQIASTECLGLGHLAGAFVIISAPFFWAGYRSLTRE